MQVVGSGFFYKFKQFIGISQKAIYFVKVNSVIQ